MKQRWILCLCLFILLNAISITKAEFTYEYKNTSLHPINKVFLKIYKCDGACESLDEDDLVVDAFSGLDSNITFPIPEGDYFREYHVTENCYPPLVAERDGYTETGVGFRSFFKVICSATISNLSVTQPATVNQEIEIKAKISSPLVDEYQQFGGKDMFVPQKLKRFFEINVTVQLLINNNIANSTEIAVPLSGKEVKFVYKFPQEGSYDITIKTTPTDCKCKSAEETEVTLSVNVQAPQEQKNCSDGTPINACSQKTRGMFCNENQELVWNCQICGCPQGQECYK